MSRPESLPVVDVLSALTLTPEKPSALALRLGVSRATLHRKLERLLKENLAVRVGNGPTSAYRRPSPLDALQAARSQSPVEGQVRLTLVTAAAYALQAGLELYSRIGIGQLEQITEGVRDRSFGPDSRYTLQELDEAEALARALKERLLGFGPGASYGIYGDKVHPTVLRAWALQRAVRHRLSWDRRPAGGFGVGHDEPLSKDTLPGLFVHSDCPDEKGEPSRYVVEMPLDCVQLLIDSLSVALRVRAGDVEAVLDMVRNQTLVSRTGKPLEEPTLSECRALAVRLTAVMTGQAPGGHNLQLDATGARMLQVLRALQGYLETRRCEMVANGDEPFVTVESVGSSPWAGDVEGMPDEMMLNFSKGEYRVIAPSKVDGVLVIVASSHSLKTAVQMARNYAQGQAPRGAEF